MCSEMSQIEKDKYYVLPLICGILKKSQTQKQSRTVVARDGCGGNGERLVKGYRPSPIKRINSEDIMYSTLATADNMVSYI